jgi:hypothetical protein
MLVPDSTPSCDMLVGTVTVTVVVPLAIRPLINSPWKRARPRVGTKPPEGGVQPPSSVMPVSASQAGWSPLP